MEAPPHVPGRYLVALACPVLATVRPFLARKGHISEEGEGMHRAWTQAVILFVALGCRLSMGEDF